MSKFVGCISIKNYQACEDKVEQGKVSLIEDTNFFIGSKGGGDLKLDHVIYNCEDKLVQNQKPPLIKLI